MECFFCESKQTVIVGGAVLEKTSLFHDVLECLECGGIQLVAPKQVVIGNLAVFTHSDGGWDKKAVEDVNGPICSGEAGSE
jgi:hypothetical protein